MRTQTCRESAMVGSGAGWSGSPAGRFGVATLAVLMPLVGCSDDATAPANRLPVVSGELPGRSLVAGVAPTEVDLSPYFSDPDGDVLVFEAASSDASVVAAALAATQLSLSGRSVGEATVTVTAADAHGTSVATTFAVRVAADADRAALLALYHATDGANWKNSANWLSDEPLREWHGVGVDSLGRVTSLELGGNGLSGPIPTELGGLTQLVSLNLGWNELSGPIPTELGGLANLGRLWLNDNELTDSIPPGLGGLTQLEELDLRGNGLTGPIPPELGGLTQLESLSLGWNELSGPIPAQLGGLTQLVSLDLRLNGLTGPIPTELGGLIQLEGLDLGGNGLIGPIPTELGGLTRLQSLSLAGNQLSGPIPSELGGLTQLESLNLGWNELSDPIPTELGGLANLQSLWLSSNELAGPIPPELGGLTQLEELDLGGNDLLSGPIPPELGGLTRLVSLNLGWNELSGPIPTELGGLANLGRLSLSSNDLTGPIPTELGGLTQLESLDLGGNGLTGPIPPELGGLANLGSLWLHDNELTGPIPAELGGLIQLEFLNLAWNELSGPLPRSLLDLAKLTRFYFSSWREERLCAPGIAEFAHWLEAMEESEGPYCNEPDTFVLERLFESAGGSGWTNAKGWLDGPVLAEWYGISADSLGRVTTLDLSRNGLAGQLTAVLGDLTHLTELRISGNADLSGRLPLSLARLSLQVLHYSGTGLCAPVETPFQDWLGMIPSHESPGAGCAQGYPINVTWQLCGWTPGPEGCLTLQEIDPDTMAILPVDVVAGMRAGIAEWAQVLAPTPAPAPYVVPPGGTPRRWDHWCRAWRDDWMPGDTIQAGLELHVVIEVDADPGDDYAPGGGSGPPCFYDTWRHGGVLVPVLTGIIYLSSPKGIRDGRDRGYVGWRGFAMHELGHVVGVGNWTADLVEEVVDTQDRSGEVVTGEAIVAAFDRLGGAEYPGKKVPVWGVHWHECVAPNDIMSSVPANVKVITDLTLSALFPGFQAEPQGYTLPTDAWHTCPELQMNGTGVIDFRYRSP